MSARIIENRPGYEESSHIFAGAEPKPFRVLIPYDGSENAELSLETLKRAGLPERLDAMIAISHARLPLSPYEITRAVSARRLKLLTPGTTSVTPATRVREEQRVLERVADAHIRSLFPTANVATDTMEGSASAVDEIVGKAKSYGAELIVLGSKISPSSQITDYAGPTMSVARNAHCSVRIGRASEEMTDSPIQFLMLLDETKSIADVLEVISERVWPAATRVYIILVGQTGPRGLVHEVQTRSEVEELTKRLRSRGLEVSIAARKGKPQDLLLQHAKEMSADCIFIHANILGGNDRRLGKLAQSVILGAECSVEIVRPVASHGHLMPAA